MKLIVWSVVVLIGFFCYVSSLGAASSGGNNPPAKVDRPGDEARLNQLKLTSKAKQRLGIVTVPVQTRDMVRYRKYSGEITLPVSIGHHDSEDRKTNQSVQAIISAMNPFELARIAESQIDADGRVNAAEVRLKAARIVLKRAEKLVADRAGSQKALDQARADYAIAAADLKTMKNRRAMLGPPVLATQAQNDLWLRVSVFVNDVDELNLDAPARVGRLGANLGAMQTQAQPISAAPKFARAGSSTVDIFYQIQNTDEKYRPNQRVGVEIPLRDKSAGLVVPRSTILHDIHGNTWVYAQVKDLTFERRRVKVLYSRDGMAVLGGGLADGVQVVTDGAAELFGTEFGVGK